MIIDIGRLDKAEVLAALYNGAWKPEGEATAREETMTIGEARRCIESGDDMVQSSESVAPNRPPLYFDYLNGRELKVDLTTTKLDTRNYDHNYGEGAASRALAPLFTEGETRE